MLNQIRTINAQANVLVLASVSGRVAAVPAKGRKCFRKNEIATLRVELAGARKRKGEQARRVYAAALASVRLVLDGKATLSNRACAGEFADLLGELFTAQGFALPDTSSVRVMCEGRYGR